ncbi:glutathione S-transferase [Fragilaria crotonensis]|nr:glutathione S-transferase [Fragilaria crotonensis]
MDTARRALGTTVGGVGITMEKWCWWYAPEFLTGRTAPPIVDIRGSPFGKWCGNDSANWNWHTQVSCPRGSPNRQIMLEEKGRFQVPYLEDPNTGVKLWESEAIVEYLQKVYGVEDSPVKYM